jgi:hypothetical protein
MVSLVLAGQPVSAETEPWRLRDSLPEWLALSGHHSTRYETLDGQFRAGRGGSDEIFVFRTAVKLEVTRGSWEVAAEVVDSRQSLADDGTPLNTTIVNALELLQAYAAISFADVLKSGDVARVQIGRYTMDLGSRRLVARNRYRNTINNFTGVNGTWTSASGVALRAFFVLPVTRRPSSIPSLRDNDIRIDEERFDVTMWGIFSTFPEVVAGARGELYFLGLHEDETQGIPSRTRRLVTFGGRLVRAADRGRVDFEIESAFQVGRSRVSSGGADVSHAASFQHVELGYTIDHEWRPRAVLQFDHASGDREADDGRNHRFDTLYGARRFDFGPTGIYGAFARSNLISPGYRVFLNPRRRVGVMAAHRFHWLASHRDAWTASGLRNPAGASDSHIGHQAEVRIRWDARPGGIRFEAGAARLFAGSLMDENGKGDATYGYLQATLPF